MGLHSHHQMPFGKLSRTQDMVEAKVPGRTPIENDAMQQGAHVSLETPYENERRSATRRRVLKGANIYFNKGYGAYQCTVKNVSEGGALAVLGESFGLPSEFDLLVNGETRPRRASICWRENGRAGLQFL